MELALCYYRQGLFDIGRSTLIRVLGELPEDSWELRSLALVRLGSLERHAGRLNEALDLIFQAIQIAELCGPWATARCYLELASIYKELAIAEDIQFYFDEATHFYAKALEEFEAIGQHRYVAIVENNMGFLLLSIGRYKDSEERLLRSRKLLENFSDILRGAQVDETLARLHIKIEEYALAQAEIEKALRTFELADNEVLLAEALTTNGIVACRLGCYNDAQKSFEAAYKISERCGDNTGAGLALLTMLEEMPDHLEATERLQIAEKLKKLLGATQHKSLKTRLAKLLVKIESYSKLATRKKRKSKI